MTQLFEEKPLKCPFSFYLYGKFGELSPDYGSWDTQCWFETAPNRQRDNNNQLRYDVEYGPRFCHGLNQYVYYQDYGKNNPEQILEEPAAQRYWQHENYGINFKSTILNKWMVMKFTCKNDTIKFVSDDGTVNTTRVFGNIGNGIDFALRIGRGLNGPVACSALFDDDDFSSDSSDMLRFKNSCEEMVAAGYDNCGNGKLESGEECDDGNTVEGDGCSNKCQAEGQRFGKSFYKMDKIIGIWPLTYDYGLSEVGFHRFNAEMVYGVSNFQFPYLKRVADSFRTEHKRISHRSEFLVFDTFTSVRLVPHSEWPMVDLDVTNSFTISFYFTAELTEDTVVRSIVSVGRAVSISYYAVYKDGAGNQLNRRKRESVTPRTTEPPQPLEPPSNFTTEVPQKVNGTVAEYAIYLKIYLPDGSSRNVELKTGEEARYVHQYPYPVVFTWDPSAKRARMYLSSILKMDAYLSGTLSGVNKEEDTIVLGWQPPMWYQPGLRGTMSCFQLFSKIPSDISKIFENCREFSSTFLHFIFNF